MNSLTDLRRTLDQHADDVTDPTAVARTAGVHHRVAAVRRRRRAAGVGALALVVLGAVIGVAWPPNHDVQPAAPVVLGQQAPSVERSLGYTYRTDGRASAGEGQTSVSVARSDQPQLYSWTTDQATSVRIVLPVHDVVHSQLSRFRDFVVVPPGQSGLLQASVAAGRVALARYTLTSAAPAGYTRDGITYRQEVAGAALLGAVIAAPGETEATTAVVAPRGTVRFTPLCTGLPSGYDLQVTLDGRLAISAGCDDSDTFDPGAQSSNEYSPLSRPGRTVTVRVFVSRGMTSGSAVSGPLPHLRLGIGLYGPIDQQRVAGYPLDTSVEHGGHLWVLNRTLTSAGQPLSVPAAQEDRVAQMVWSAPGEVRASFAARGTTPQVTVVRNSPGGSGGTGDLWVPAGAPATARTAHDKGPFGVALYTRAD